MAESLWNLKHLQNPNLCRYVINSFGIQNNWVLKVKQFRWARVYLIPKNIAMYPWCPDSNTNFLLIWRRIVGFLAMKALLPMACWESSASLICGRPWLSKTCPPAEWVGHCWPTTRSLSCLEGGHQDRGHAYLSIQWNTWEPGSFVQAYE